MWRAGVMHTQNFAAQMTKCPMHSTISLGKLLAPKATLISRHNRTPPKSTIATPHLFLTPTPKNGEREAILTPKNGAGRVVVGGPIRQRRPIEMGRIGDLCFFYHSGPKLRCVVGVVSVVREWYSDDSGAVDVRAVGEMRRAVDLKEMIGDKGFVLFRQPRLSVVPVGEGLWGRIASWAVGLEEMVAVKRRVRRLVGF